MVVDVARQAVMEEGSRMVIDLAGHLVLVLVQLRIEKLGHMLRICIPFLEASW